MAVFGITLYAAVLRKSAVYRVISNTAIVRYKTSLSQKHNKNHPKYFIFSGILEESPTKEDNFATTKAKYFYQSCMNMCK